MEISKSHNLMKEALNYRSLRQDLISSNLANVDTPFYRPKDVNFGKILAAKANHVFNGKPTNELKLAGTHDAHLQPNDVYNNKATVYFRDGHLARNDGNSVDLDVESTEMTKNTTMYNALVAAIKKDSGLFKQVIESSSRQQ